MKMSRVTFSVLAIVSLFAAFSILGCASAPASSRPSPASSPPSEENVGPGNEKSVAEYYKELEDEYWRDRTVTIRSEASGKLYIFADSMERIEIGQSVSIPARELIDVSTISVSADTDIPMNHYSFQKEQKKQEYGSVSVVGAPTPSPSNRNIARKEWEVHLRTIEADRLPKEVTLSVDTDRIKREAWALGIKNQNVKIPTGNSGEYITIAVGEESSRGQIRGK
jgi:hypothetical protein